MRTREQLARLIYTTTTAATRCEHPGCAYLIHTAYCPQHHQRQDQT